jgi:primosomal protein N' (replication factor Y)
MKYVEVILPLALHKLLTYAVPAEWEGRVAAGMRVQAPVGQKSYTALVRRVHATPPTGFEAKAITALLDEQPTVNEKQLQHWEQLAGYYLCSVGEVMKAALPGGLRT